MAKHEKINILFKSIKKKQHSFELDISGSCVLDKGFLYGNTYTTLSRNKNYGKMSSALVWRIQNCDLVIQTVCWGKVPFWFYHEYLHFMIICLKIVFARAEEIPLKI